MPCRDAFPDIKFKNSVDKILSFEYADNVLRISDESKHRYSIWKMRGTERVYYQNPRSRGITQRRNAVGWKHSRDQDNRSASGSRFCERF